jgi:hypothetical protein
MAEIIPLPTAAATRHRHRGRIPYGIVRLSVYRDSKRASAHSESIRQKLMNEICRHERVIDTHRDKLTWPTFRLAYDERTNSRLLIEYAMERIHSCRDKLASAIE